MGFAVGGFWLTVPGLLLSTVNREPLTLIYGNSTANCVVTVLAFSPVPPSEEL